MKDIFEPYWSQFLDKFNIQNELFKIPNNTDKYCVIIEPRESPILEKVIKNFMSQLQKKNWGLIIFHGENNDIYIKEKLKNMKNVNFINLGIDNLNNKTYNQLLKSKQFWKILIDKFNCDKCLIFQLDTLLLKDNIEDFNQYDFLGAPWAIKFKGLYEVGNGGLSLRSTKKMLEICEKIISNEKENEDIYFSRGCSELNFNLPTKEIAMKFSVETIFYDDPMGLHNPYINNFKQEYIDLMERSINKNFQL